MSKLRVLSTFLGDYGKSLCKAAFCCYKIFSVETIGRQTSVYQVLVPSRPIVISMVRRNDGNTDY